MVSPENNLLVRLHKWAWRQDENFLTDAFAHLLQHLLDEEPEAAVGLLESTTGNFLKLGPGDAKAVEVRTQVVLTEGRPDLEIRAGQQLVFMEVKSEAEPSGEQLKRYKQLLRESGCPSTCLVLLTRYPASIAEEDSQPNYFIRWYQVADWLEQQSNRYTFKPVSQYLVEQFLGFLKGRSMTMSQVTWELPGGVRALRSLTDMLSEAAQACGVQAQPWGTREWMGVNLAGKQYSAGIYFSRPEALLFETYRRKVDKDKAERLGVGSVFELEDKSGFGWARELNLESEDVHFFARSKPSQMQLLEGFLRESLELVKKAELAAEAPAQDEISGAEGEEELPPST